MNTEQKRIFRADIFRHLDGIVTAPTAYCLLEKGVLDYLVTTQTTTLSTLTEVFQANEGYLNVALHTMASQGWINYDLEDADTIKIQVNEMSEAAFAHIPLYKDVVELLQLSKDYHNRKFEVEPFLVLEGIFERFKSHYDITLSEDERTRTVQQQVLKHIEGILIGPTIVALGMSGMFHKYFMEASFKPEEFHSDKDSFGRLLDFFVHLEWFEKANGTFRFTEKGVFFAKRASAYGVTVSYIPAFRRIEELIFGDPTIFWNLPKGSKEIHVDRKMNVWGSGGAHSAYFEVVDKIIIDIFNQPIEKQPRGIVDIGCGNGAFLIHMYELIEKRTLRGQLLEEHPLFLVGADFNKAALDVTRENIIQSQIWAKLIWGDIGRPDLLAQDLKDNYHIDLKELLNVRTFLDHNRIWEDPQYSDPDRHSNSTGAFSFRGKRITNIEVEENLREHFLKWSPFLEKYGLLVIELHTISPSLISKNLGKTAATAYNATHGFSDQYIVELEVFHKVATEVGLIPDEKHFTKFPNSELASVSINLLKQK